MSNVLGKISFLDTPDVNGQNVMLNGGGVPIITAGITSARPAAGSYPGQLYLDTTLNILYRDNGTTWDSLDPVPAINGTTNQISVVQGTNVTPSVISLTSNPVIPGTASMTLPVGTTGQRPTGVAGMARFNSTSAMSEFYTGAYWAPSGTILQVVTGVIAAGNGTTATPIDNTVPQSTEGNQMWTQSFTPISATSRVVIIYSVTAGHSTTNASMVAATFAGTTNIGSTMTRSASQTAGGVEMSQKVVYSPGSTAAITFSARIGSTATSYWNSTPSVTLGGSMASDYIIMELA
jgi:hypothetical protein